MVSKNIKISELESEIIEFDDLEQIVGGAGDIIALHRYECKCGWISDTLTQLPSKPLCEFCGNKEKKDFIRYAFVNGVWIKMDEWKH